MRSAFYEALCILAADNQNTVPQELASWIKETPAKERPRWFASMAAFKPREKTIKGEISIETRHTFPQLQGQIAGFIADLTKGTLIEGELVGASDVGPDRLVVPDKTRTEPS
jgi:hypothetical protein